MSIIPFLNRVISVILNPLIVLVFAVALLYFIYGIVKFLSLDVQDAKRKEARDAIFWGMVGMFIMVSVYGIIGFVLDTFGVSQNDIHQNAKQFIKW